jgi:hypothetical protein
MKVSVIFDSIAGDPRDDEIEEIFKASVENLKAAEPY